jgi:HAD superfamily hydrolase (TIGR01549 family)
VSETCAVLFDIDGTLVDSTYHHALAWQRAFRDLDVVVPFFLVHRSVGMGGDKLVAHVAGEDVERRHGDRLRSAWRERYDEIKGEVAPLPGAAALVRRVAEAGFQVALASSGDPQLADEAVALLGIGDVIATLATSQDVDDSKPEPDLVVETVARLDGVTHAVLVGDTPYDAEAARKSGIGCVALRSGGYSEAELRAAGAAFVVDLPEDLAGLDWAGQCRAIGHRGSDDDV